MGGSSAAAGAAGVASPGAEDGSLRQASHQVCARLLQTMKRTAEEASGWGAQHPAKRSAPPPSKSKYAFKILCPDKLAVALLGTRGATKEWIQNETGTRLVFSNRGNYFPTTSYRTLGIYSDEAPNIPKALERILKRVVECGNEERKRSKGQAPEFAGDVEGEYVFRACLSDRSARALIGPGGASIGKLRSSTGAKVTVADQSQQGSQMVRIVGQPEVVLDCLRKVHTVVQQGVGTEDFIRWAHSVNFEEKVPRQVPPPVRTAAGVAGNASYHADAKAAAPPHPPSAPDGALLDQRTEQLADAVAHLPPGAALLQYSITCAVPSGHVDAISEYVPSVEQVSGAAVEIDPPPEDPEEAAAASERLLSVVGPLLNIYAAHVLIVKRSKELAQCQFQEEQRRRPPEQDEHRPQGRGTQEPRWGAQGGEEHARQQEEVAQDWAEEEAAPLLPSKEELQAKIDSLQAQLEQVKAAALAASGGGAKPGGGGPRPAVAPMEAIAARAAARSSVPGGEARVIGMVDGL
eukprot:CAMPEP_0175653452 /NCGR_PEP_ID=MMETSP0097-20121207/10894_1 /TAXON_ID=311494 /ORGANISM="Alexandrium monilatum, Strain CCMP3105" /LENGTH=519 /DNA_ID=CAMNT_0016959481 /DNA_START=55 /DNA_END=1612 /DNA_ORIENTATION=-